MHYTSDYNSIFFFLVSVLALNKKVRILDFGGNVGLNYKLLKKQSVKTFYTILEKEKICEAGKSMHKNDKDIKFYSTFPHKNSSYDIVYLGSTLQYIDEWKLLLQKLSLQKPQYILIADIPTSTSNTFITSQKYYGQEISYIFFNLTELINFMKKNQYKLINTSIFSPSNPHHSFEKNIDFGSEKIFNDRHTLLFSKYL